jgi:hypothetical protein
VAKLDWNFDRAASGDRLRAFTKTHEICFYLQAPHTWYVHRFAGYETEASGTENSQRSARKRAVRVYRALTRKV